MKNEVIKAKSDIITVTTIPEGVPAPWLLPGASLTQLARRAPALRCSLFVEGETDEKTKS